MRERRLTSSDAAKRTTTRVAIVALFALSSIVSGRGATAQNFECTLGKVTERVQPQYPLQLQGRIVEGDVSVLATFAPDGRVSSSKAISGPSSLQFEARAYISGWRAEPSTSPRQCVIHIQYRFDGSQAVCTRGRDVNVRPERLSDTAVLVHLACDAF